MIVELVVGLAVILLATVASVVIMRRTGIRTARPTTWMGRAPYIAIAVGLVVLGSFLIASGH